MLTVILTLLVSCLILFPLSEEAYLVLGPLEVKDTGAQSKSQNETEIRAKALPKREFKVSREKQKSKSVTSKIEDDVEIIEQIPYCTNIFKSSICTKEMKNANVENKNKDNGVGKVNQNIVDIKRNQLVETSKNTKHNERFDNAAVIEKLKRELDEEREKVRNLTDELNSVRRMCEDSYDYEDSDLIPCSDGKLQSVKSSDDLYNLMSGKKENDQICYKDSSKNCRALSNNIRALSNLTKNKIKDEFNQAFLNEDRINKDLFKDNVYQIPNFSVNDQKNYKNPLFTSDLSILNQNSVGYGNVPLPKANIILPYKDSNVHEDILKTLYPQFFTDEFGDVVDNMSHLKRGSTRCLIEPDQIYVNNMKQLTAPYKIFPGQLNPDIRYYNIRDRRDPNIKLHKKQNNLGNYEKLAEEVERCIRNGTVDDVKTLSTELQNIYKKDSPILPNSLFKLTKGTIPTDSAFKINGGTLKLQESIDGDDNSKENYFESSKESELQKNDEMYNRFLKKYLNRIKELKLDDILNTNDIGNENVPEEETTEEIDKNKDKYFDNPHQKEIESMQVRKTQMKPSMETLILKTFERVNKTNKQDDKHSEESSTEYDISDQDNDENSEKENSHTLSEMKKQENSLKDIENNDENDLTGQIKKKENHSLKRIKENDDALKDIDDSKYIVDKASRKKINYIGKDNEKDDIISKESDQDTNESKLSKNDDDDDDTNDECENELNNSENDSFHENYRNRIGLVKDSSKDLDHSPKMKRNREENLDDQLVKGDQIKRNMRKNKLNKNKKNCRNHENRYYKQKLH